MSKAKSPLSLLKALVLVITALAVNISPLNTQFAHAGSGDNYLWKTANYPDCTGQIDPWGYCKRNCTSWVAWALHDRNGFEIANIPNNAQYWGTWAQQTGHTYTVDNTPAVGAVAWWAAYVLDDGYTISQYGHVAYVQAVSGNTASIEEYNYGNTGVYHTRNITRSSNQQVQYIHFTAPPPSYVPYSYQADSYSDLAILHKNAGDNAFNIHVLYGSGGTPFQYTPTFASAFPASSNWDWSKVKTSSGDYDSDGYTDIALLHQTSDGGANAYFIKGSGGTPLQYTSTVVKSLPASSGWDWSKMILESGKFQSDNYADLAILQQTSDGGFDANVLYGGSSTPFQIVSQPAEHFDYSNGWDWTKIKTTSGDYNGDGYSDIGIVRQDTADNAKLHVLWGGGGIPFTNPYTYVKDLPSTSGWYWSKMKITSGKYQYDNYADIAIVQQRPSTDTGFNVHVLYGSSGTPFGTTDTSVSTYPGSSNWDWNSIKIATGMYNSDGYSDIAFLHQTGDTGANNYIIWGSGGTPLTTYSLVLSMPHSSGWTWSDMILNSSQQN